MENIIELKSIKKGYIVKKRSLLVLDDLSVSFEKGKCVIVVSHSDEVKKYADKLYELDDRNIVEVK